MYCDTIILHCVCEQTEELEEARREDVKLEGQIIYYKCSFLRASRRLLVSASYHAHSGAAQGESGFVKSYLK
jgi:hypothetical protein